MIYKDSDNKLAVVAILERMLALAGPDKRPLLERELRMMRAGIASEREAAGLINVYLKDSTRTAVVHDLRLVSASGETAHIDHLLIHRSRRFFILDTRHFNHGLRITDDGDFLCWNDAERAYEPVPSPLEGQARQVSVLRDALEPFGLDDAPVETLLMLAPNARIDRPRRFDTSRVVKADGFMEKLNNALDGAPALSALGALNRTMMPASIGDIAQKLVSLHRPSTADTMARFGLGREPRLPQAGAGDDVTAGAALAGEGQAAQGEARAPYTFVADSMRST